MPGLHTSKGFLSKEFVDRLYTLYHHRGLQIPGKEAMNKSSGQTHSARYHLRLTAQKIPPWIWFEETDQGWKVEGFFEEMLDYLTRAADFSYTIVDSPDGMAATRLPNGSWAGMMGLMERKEADVILGPFSAQEGHCDVVDLTTPHYTEQTYMLLNWPSGERDTFGLITVFTPELWIATFLTFVFVTFAMAIPTRFYRKLSVFKALSEKLWDTARMYMMEDIPHVPQDIASRIIITTMLVAMLVLSTSFSSNLIAIFTSVSTPALINTVKDLAEEYKGIIYLALSIPPYTVLPKTQNEAYQKLWNKIISSPGWVRDVDFMLSPKILQDVRMGKAVLLLPFMPILAAISSVVKQGEDCTGFRIGEEGMELLMLPIGLQKDLDPHLKRKIKLSVSWYVATGIFERQVWHQLGEFQACLQAPYNRDEVKPLTINDMSGLFIIWCIGCLMAIGAFIAELIVDSIKKHAANITRHYNRKERAK